MLRSQRHIFRQLFDQESWTFTYLLACLTKREAVLVDPVDTQVERDLKLLEELNLELKYARFHEKLPQRPTPINFSVKRINTHCHADHITGTGILKTKTKCRSLISAQSGAQADILLNDGDKIQYGDMALEALATPGHTDGCMIFTNHEERFALTGDTLLIRACGRTDFQQGDPKMLYDSVHKKIFALPDDFSLFPAHDYKGHSVTTVSEEKTLNPRLSKSKEEFVEVMKKLGLAYPKKIDEAVPWNMMCGPTQLGQVRMDGE